jgi:hypothetical protein
MMPRARTITASETVGATPLVMDIGRAENGAEAISFIQSRL